jgi:hypothetical protein
MANSGPFEGGCLCGFIRFRASGEPELPHTCSCEMCRRHSGALTVAWVEFPATAVDWTGKGGKPVTWRSSEASSRAYCPQCGSTLGAIDDAPVIALTVGAFDDAGQAALKPTDHSFVDKRPDWWHVQTK